MLTAPAMSILRCAVFMLSCVTACATPATTSRKAAGYASGLAGPTSTPVGSGAPLREDSTCYPQCQTGYRCNEAVARCERLPCLGRCRADQRCDSSGPLETCVDAASP
jgi:hypothetical protein